MTGSPNWELLAKTLVQIQLRIVLAQEAEEAIHAAIGYVRVSTEDQVENSPEAQRTRCLQFAISHGIGPVTFLADEGRSGKNLDRHGMQQLIELVESGSVAHVIV